MRDRERCWVSNKVQNLHIWTFLVGFWLVSNESLSQIETRLGSTNTNKSWFTHIDAENIRCILHTQHRFVAAFGTWLQWRWLTLPSAQQRSDRVFASPGTEDASLGKTGRSICFPTARSFLFSFFFLRSVFHHCLQRVKRHYKAENPLTFSLIFLSSAISWFLSNILYVKCLDIVYDPCWRYIQSDVTGQLMKCRSFLSVCGRFWWAHLAGG